MYGIPILEFTLQSKKWGYSAVVIFTYFLHNKYDIIDKEQTKHF